MPQRHCKRDQSGEMRYRIEVNPANLRGITNELRIEPAKEKAELPSLITIPFIEVRAEDLSDEIAPVEIVDEKELPLVVGVSAAEQDGAADRENQKKERPQPPLGAPTESR